jgi:dipeptidyl aminopeptidase/acylaminoacyl peptidase
MKKFLSILFVILTSSTLWSQQRREVGNLVMEDMPDIPDRIIERMNQYQSVRSATFLDWDPAASGMLISTRFGETAQIHYVAKPGGTRQQITFFREPVSGASFHPNKDEQTFLFTMDIGGGEFYQILIFDLKTGKYRMLTDGKSRNTGGLWSNTGKWFAFSSTKRNGKDADIYLMDVSKPSNTKMLVEVTGQWSGLDWSPDDSKILVGQYISVNESRIYIVDVAAGSRELLNPERDKKISYTGARWGRDGKGVYYASDENGEFQELIYLDLRTKTKTILTEDLSWDVSDFELSRDGKWLMFVTNEGGISKLHLMNLKSKKQIPIQSAPVGVIGGLKFSPNSTQIAMTVNTSQTPGDVYTLDMKSKRFERWTFSEVGGLNTAGFVTPELIEYPTFDQVNGKPRMIPALYFKPKVKPDRPFPVIITIHGGPEGQALPTFSSVTQYWVNEMGCAVILPNVRGSTGYGKTYVQLDNGFKREESVQDIGKLLDWIASRPELDKDRVSVYGGSYGGYMVLSSMCNFDDRLKCAVDVVGISNFITFLESTQEYRRDLRRAEYGDERDPKMREFLESISPTTNAYKIKRPLFVVAGYNDPRVPVTEGEQMVKTVRKNGVPVWYLMAKDEGHGFQKKVNRDYYTNAMTMFFENYLLK